METEPDPRPKPSPIVPPRRGAIWGVAAAAVLVALFGLWRRKQAAATRSEPRLLAPVVAVARVEREDLANEVPVSGDFRPYTEVELHAKVSGFLDRMNVDIGDRVKAGQLLATIEVPELRDELDNAVAAQQHAEADYTNAHLIWQRLDGVVRQHPNLLAQQDIDTATAKDRTGEATVAEAKAEAGKYRTLMGYTQITAPFDGVITHRYVDPGALVEAGTLSDSARPLLRISDNYHLRMDFPVSVEFVKDIHVGDNVEVRVESLDGRTFSGAITRFADRVDMETRTMIVEMEVANPTLDIVPGMYASVMLKVEKRPRALAIPIGAISGGKKDTVDVVGANNELEERAITLGLETPTKYEVLSGLKEGEMVVVGNPGQIKPGQRVEAKLEPQVSLQ